MAFTPKTWRDFPNATTPLTAAALIDVETRVTDYTDTEAEAAQDAAESLANAYTDTSVGTIVSLGNVGAVWKGAWGSGTTYAKGDGVSSGTLLYVSVQNSNTNHSPATDTTGTWWVAVTNSGFGVDASRYGVLPGVNCAAILQSLLDSLYTNRGTKRGDTIYLPAGNYTFESEVSYYVENGYAQHIIGAGAFCTRISAATDFGAGNYLLRPSQPRSSIQKSVVQGFSYRGNPVSAAWNMSGVAIASGCTARDLYCEGGFHAGLEPLNDHTFILDCEAHGCTFNLYFGYQYQAKDNHIIRGGNYTDALFACIGVSGNNGLGGSELSGFHVGNSDYCFYKEDAADTAGFATFKGNTMETGGLNSFFSSNELTGIRFENTEIAIFGAENSAGGAQISDNLFMGCDQSGATEYFSATFLGAFQCDHFRNNVFIRAETLLVPGTDLAVVKSVGSGGGVSGNYVRCKGEFPTFLVAQTMDNKTREGWRFEDGLCRQYVPVKVDENVYAGDLLAGWVGGFAGSVKRFDTSFASACCGVALRTIVSGNYVFRQTRGYCDRVNLDSAASPDSGRHLIPTATTGRASHVAPGVAASASPIGRALSGNNSATKTGGATTNGSATVTMTSTSGIVAGDLITGTGIPAGTVVTVVTNATTITISANATATNTGLTFTYGYTCSAELSI